MITLEDRLTRLELDIDGLDVTGDVLARLDSRDAGGGRSWLRVAAVAVVLVAVAVALIPGSRRTVAGWLGLDAVRVERLPGLDVPDGPSTFELPGPGETTTMEIDGQTILVSTLDGSLDDVSLVKTVGFDTEVDEIRVNGERGLWISGSTHLVAYDHATGRNVAVAGNTLLWEDGDVLHRVEGFATLADARRLAAMLAEH